MLKSNFKHLKKVDLKKKAYAKPELYPLGRATFLTHGASDSGSKEEDANGQEYLFPNSNG